MVTLNHESGSLFGASLFRVDSGTKIAYFSLISHGLKSAVLF
jgi:hypothetical protein